MHDDMDEDLEAWDQFVTAVRCLSRSARPGLTLAEATQEALMGWVEEQSAVHTAGDVFGGATSCRRGE